MARVVARSHHENFDGTGYPDNLRARDIPLAARIVRLADVFDALHSDRPYKSAWDFGRCVEEIKRRSGELFDPDLAKLFTSYLDEHHAELDAQTPVLPLGPARRSARGRAPRHVSLPESAL
jgi:HD-GYP domain-containing protein (c-di-GMP phosphodiesterase class II)